MKKRVFVWAGCLAVSFLMMFALSACNNESVEVVNVAEAILGTWVFEEQKPSGDLDKTVMIFTDDGVCVNITYRNDEFFEELEGVWEYDEENDLIILNQNPNLKYKASFSNDVLTFNHLAQNRISQFKRQ